LAKESAVHRRGDAPQRQQLFEDTMKLTQTRLKEVLDYNPETGAFVWKINRRGRAKSGSIAGAIKTGNYIQIMVDGKMYLAHRLVWTYVYGELPSEKIDHINRITNDNRIENLRLVNNKQNRENISLAKNNTSGHTGVYWLPKQNKWQAKIGHNKKIIFLGNFCQKSEAIMAMKQAEKQYFTHRSVS
jgi:hypothetical protein